MDAKGSIVVGELILPVVDIYLDDGRIWVAAQVTGPVPAVSTGSYVVCDRNGEVVYRSQGDAGRISWPAMCAGPTLRVTAALRAEGKQATPEGPAVTVLG